MTATTFGGPCPSAVLAVGSGCRLIGTTTIGSPPNGLFPTTAHTTNTPRNSVNTAAMTCDVVIGIFMRRFRSCWPSGAFRSSAVMVRSHVPAPFCRANRSRIMQGTLSRPVYCRFGARLRAFRRFRDLPPKTKNKTKKIRGGLSPPRIQSDEPDRLFSSEPRSSDSAGRRRWSWCRARGRAPFSAPRRPSRPAARRTASRTLRCPRP